VWERPHKLSLAKQHAADKLHFSCVSVSIDSLSIRAVQADASLSATDWRAGIYEAFFEPLLLPDLMVGKRAQ
jgi:hypothetical protein